MNDQFLSENYIQVPSAVPGIEVFAPVNDTQEGFQRIVEFKCPQCGGQTAYSVVDGGLTCTHCGYHQASDLQVVGKQAREFEFTLETMREASHGWGQERSQLA